MIDSIKTVLNKIDTINFVKDTLHPIQIINNLPSGNDSFNWFTKFLLPIIIASVTTLLGFGIVWISNKVREKKRIEGLSKLVFVWIEETITDLGELKILVEELKKETADYFYGNPQLRIMLFDINRILQIKDSDLFLMFILGRKVEESSSQNFYKLFKDLRIADALSQDYIKQMQISFAAFIANETKIVELYNKLAIEEANLRSYVPPNATTLADAKEGVIQIAFAAKYMSEIKWKVKIEGMSYSKFIETDINQKIEFIEGLDYIQCIPFLKIRDLLSQIEFELLMAQSYHDKVANYLSTVSTDLEKTITELTSNMDKLKNLKFKNWLSFSSQ